MDYRTAYKMISPDTIVRISDNNLEIVQYNTDGSEDIVVITPRQWIDILEFIRDINITCHTTGGHA